MLTARELPRKLNSLPFLTLITTFNVRCLEHNGKTETRINRILIHACPDFEHFLLELPLECFFFLTGAGFPGSGQGLQSKDHRGGAINQVQARVDVGNDLLPSTALPKFYGGMCKDVCTFCCERKP